MSNVRALQLILHLPLLNIIMPSNVMQIFEIIIPIVMFDVFENDYGIGPSLIMEFDDEK